MTPLIASTERCFDDLADFPMDDASTALGGGVRIGVDVVILDEDENALNRIPLDRPLE